MSVEVTRQVVGRRDMASVWAEDATHGPTEYPLAGSNSAKEDERHLRL